MQISLLILIVSWFFPVIVAEPMAAWGANASERQPMSLEQRFRQWDKNDNGKLTSDEAPYPQLIKRFDVNGDGVLTLREIRSRFRSESSRMQRVASPPEANVLQTEHTLMIDGHERAFIVQAPKQAAGKLPVVFFFHGGGGRAESVAGVFQDLAARENFLAVYPQAWKNHWNDGRKAKAIPAQVENVDDVKFVRAIVDDLAKRHEIDRSRIFASGPSNGGIFSHCLAAKAADLFAGIAPIIGGLAEPLAAEFRPSRPISLLVIQGDADPLVPFAGGPIMGSNRRGRIIATEQMLRKYLAHNGIVGEPEMTTLPDADPNDGTITQVRRYPPGKDGVRVKYYLVKGGGHTMPGSRRGVGREAIVGKTSRDFYASEVIWRFFKSCPTREQSTKGKSL